MSAHKAGRRLPPMYPTPITRWHPEAGWLPVGRIKEPNHHLPGRHLNPKTAAYPTTTPVP